MTDSYDAAVELAGELLGSAGRGPGGKPVPELAGDGGRSVTGSADGMELSLQIDSAHRQPDEHPGAPFRLNGELGDEGEPLVADRPFDALQASRLERGL